MINKDISSLINYAINNGMLHEEDSIIAINSLLNILKVNDFVFVKEKETPNIEDILNSILDYSIENKIIDNNIIEKDLFDTLLIGYVMPSQYCVNEEFKRLYKKSPQCATDYLYDLAYKSNYIRDSRIKKNQSWIKKSSYGDLVITINLSKPEKDPKAIALEKNSIATDYPKCVLCYENIGFYGNVKRQARQNLRAVKLNINNKEWYLQYSPYIYYNEHCILFSKQHEPMKISEDTFKELLDFIEMFPNYFLGSNADLPIVGGSILSHNHYQGGQYKFPIFSAKTIGNYRLEKYSNCTIEILDWPLDVLRICSNNKEELQKLANSILSVWRDYSNGSINLFSKTNEQHNTITPIARYENNSYALYLVLRNNYTTNEYPFGLFHPDVTLHNIKKENIGLIEVMGLAILPARLQTELNEVNKMLLSKEYDSDKVNKHLAWSKNIDISKENYIEEEVGSTFVKVLECCSVFRFGNRIAEIKKFIELLK